MTKDGHLGKCKNCTKKDAKERYNSEEGREKVKKYEKERFKTQNRKDKVREYRRKRSRLHPGKTKANAKVNNMIRDGKLKKLPCEICGDPKSQAHHPDYRKPLFVKWLCFKHHREEHGQKI